MWYRNLNFTFSSPNYYFKLYQSGSNLFVTDSVNVGFKSNIKLCTVLRRFLLDITPDSTDSLVEFNTTLDLVQRTSLSNLPRHWTWFKESLVEFTSTLDLVQRRALSSLTRHWTWFNGELC